MAASPDHASCETTTITLHQSREWDDLDDPAFCAPCRWLVDGAIAHDEEKGWLAYCEPEMPPNGGAGSAVILRSGAKELTADDTHVLAVNAAKPDKPFVCCFAAVWDWSGDFLDARPGEACAKNISEPLTDPHKVDIVRSSAQVRCVQAQAGLRITMILQGSLN